MLAVSAWPSRFAGVVRKGQTWLNVGYFNIHDDLRMSFQMILTNALDCGSGDFDVEFRYNRCEWTTGDASDGVGGFGGTPAQAGFDAGNGVDFVEIPGSRTMVKETTVPVSLTSTHSFSSAKHSGQDSRGGT